MDSNINLTKTKKMTNYTEQKTLTKLRPLCHFVPLDDPTGKYWVLLVNMRLDCENLRKETEIGLVLLVNRQLSRRLKTKFA